MIPAFKRSMVTIFEGPDGAGKTTTAVEYARMTGAAYFHHGPYKDVSNSLCRMVFDTMLPALLGHQDVVIDRCWLSDPIYGRVFRGGENRVTCAQRRIMDRIALSCGAVLVNCRPPWSYVEESFLSRPEEELLDNTDQLREVYNAYEDLQTDLSEVVFDWTSRRREPRKSVLLDLLKDVTHLSRPHLTSHLTNGSNAGKVLLVGSSFDDYSDSDSFFQLPFSSLRKDGWNLWLANQLEDASISEQFLTWADAGNIHVPSRGFSIPVIALGDEAHCQLKTLGVDSTLVPSPSYWRKFNSGKQYPLIAAIRKVIYE
jgi:hypothetical protein